MGFCGVVFVGLGGRGLERLVLPCLLCALCLRAALLAVLLAAGVL